MTERRPNQPFSAHKKPQGYGEPVTPQPQLQVAQEPQGTRTNSVIGEFFGKYQSVAERQGQPKETRKEKLIRLFSESCTEGGILSGMVESAEQLKAHNEDDVSLSINPHMSYRDSDPVLELFWNRQLKSTDNHTYYRQKGIRCELVKEYIKIFPSGSDRSFTLTTSTPKEDFDRTIVEAILLARIEIDTVARPSSSATRRRSDMRRKQGDEKARLYLVK